MWLLAAVLLVYAPTFFFGLTELDDSIFIREFREYNEDITNLFTSFSRGLFDAVKDPYYRPLFMNSMIINFKLSGGGENIVVYHVVNVLFHALSVVLLFRLFLKLGIRELHSFLLALVFAVHPVISQAVAWIPGRNDTLLAIFIFSFLIFSINYTKEGNVKDLIWSQLFLLLAYFTKETAVFAAPVALVLQVLALKSKLTDKRLHIQLGLWALCFAIWYAARAAATTQASVSSGQMLSDFFRRLPLIVQYLGKIFIPVNLSVFPIQHDTVYHYGITAIVLLAAIIMLSKRKDLSIVLAGALVFLLFLLPALIVPQKLNEQSFEHRLYLPLAGILLLLSQTSLLQNKLNDKQLFGAGAVICGLFAVLNYMHQANFKDPLSFWSQAAATSPNSAYANMMLGARIPNDAERSAELFRKAYKLNPKEKYINYYYAEMLLKKDSVLAAEKYLLEEKKISNYYQCDFYLARVAMVKQDRTGAIGYLKSYLQRDPANSMANNNLLLLYGELQQADSARAHIRNMRQQGIEVPAPLLKQLGM